MKVKSESEVAQLCPTLSDPMDCSLPGSSVHGIFQARVLEWGAIAFSTRVLEGEKNLAKEQTGKIRKNNFWHIIQLSYSLEIYVWTISVHA